MSIPPIPPMPPPGAGQIVRVGAGAWGTAPTMSSSPRWNSIPWST